MLKGAEERASVRTEPERERAGAEERKSEKKKETHRKTKKAKVRATEKDSEKAGEEKGFSGWQEKWYVHSGRNPEI